MRPHRPARIAGGFRAAWRRYPCLVPHPRRLLQHRLFAELATFGLVGGLCLVTDIVLFNVLAFGVGMLPELAKAITMAVTAAMAFVGHKTVTFRHRRGRGLRHEVPMFTAVTVLSLVAGLGPLWLVRQADGMGGPIWLNAANLVGIALGTVVRYVAYRKVVWARPHAEGSAGGRPATAEVGSGV